MLCAAVTNEMYFNFYFNFLKTPAPSELKTRDKILENIGTRPCKNGSNDGNDCNNISEDGNAKKSFREPGGSVMIIMGDL